MTNTGVNETVMIKTLQTGRNFYRIPAPLVLLTAHVQRTKSGFHGDESKNVILVLVSTAENSQLYNQTKSWLSLGVMQAKLITNNNSDSLKVFCIQPWYLILTSINICCFKRG
jgi:hypothetical protein